MSKIEPAENNYTIEELRHEVRRCWDTQFELVKALRDLPEIPHWRVLDLLDRAGKFPDDWEAGKRLQSKHGLKAIPPRAEYEQGAGFWERLRAGLVKD